MCTVNADETNANTIRNRNAYMIKDYIEIGKVMLPYALLCGNHMLSEFYYVFGMFSEYYKEETMNGTQNTENQESESLEPGYAPRYLVKQRVKELVHRQGEVLSEFVQEKLATAGEKFHDVVHEIISNKVVCQGIRVAVFLGTPVGLITWIILAYFSSVFLREVTRSTRRRRKTRGERKAQATSRKQCKSLLLAALVYSNLETAKGMEDALRKLTEINAQTLQGIQTLAEEIRTSAAASSQRETGLTQAFQDTIASVQQQQTQAQQALAATQTNAVTTFEEIGSSLEKAVKERKPGEVELHKLIKAPDAFNPGNWQEEKSGWTEFRSRMRVWLGAVDNTMIRIMDIVERDLKEDKMVKIDDMSAEAKEASRRLYSVLCNYTKGRPYRVVKHVAEENGMEAYRMLLKEYQPTNRARSLELFHNILNYRFAQNKGIAENILEYEEKIEQYEKATGEKVQENLKVSTLIQGMKPEVKRHLLLNMDEKTKYSALRQYLVNYESTERWTNSLSQGSGRTTTDLIEKGEDHGGLAMMDVSQAWYKGKGKWYKGLGKGKGKGKGKVERTSEKVSALKAKVKVKEKALEVLEKVEVEAIGKAEVEALEATKAKVEVEVKVTVVSRAKAKEKPKQQQEFAITAMSMDTLKHSAGKSNATWVTKQGTLT